MKIQLDQSLPEDIEKRSFEIIESELKTYIPEDIKPIVKRVIHTTADFSYAENMRFSPEALEAAVKAVKGRVNIFTDTNMALAGINKKALSVFGIEAKCFMSDEDVARAARENKTTRAAASVDKAALEGKDFIYAVGNAPTALIRLYELIREEKIKPKLIVGAPVGFVNVVESKELIMSLNVPYIVCAGRKGGSNVAAAIVNAILYMAGGRKQNF